MHTLSISEIFSNFDFYQENYLSILSEPNQYYIAVDSAYIHIHPFEKTQLFLGDLLQLWFSGKWKVAEQQATSLTETLFEEVTQKSHLELYIYQIENRHFFGKNLASTWSFSDAKTKTIECDSALKAWCEYKLLSRPKSQALFNFQHYA